jgi:hypothetical protein
MTPEQEALTGERPMTSIETTIKRAMLGQWLTPSEIAERSDLPVGIVLVELNRMPVRTRKVGHRTFVQLGEIAALGAAIGMFADDLKQAFTTLATEIGRVVLPAFEALAKLLPPSAETKP